jgi:dolichol kinase
MGILYLLFAALYFMPCLFLYRYSKAIAAIPGTGVGALEEALKNQKSFWKFMGVVAAILVSIEVLVLVIAILVGLAAHH